MQDSTRATPWEDLPFATATLPGIGGRLKALPEDFIVEEIPEVEPSGTGEHLFVWVEKSGIDTPTAQRAIAEHLGLNPDSISYAGLKDSQAITKQYICLPAKYESALSTFQDERVIIHSSKRHSHKLKRGMLRGNRFRVLLRDSSSDAATLLASFKNHFDAKGFPNYFGPQRFGTHGQTLARGLKYLDDSKDLSRTKRLTSFQRLALCSVQSMIFNEWLAQRIRDDLADTFLEGDLISHRRTGILKWVQSPGDIDSSVWVPTGPLPGGKMRMPRGAARAREVALGDSLGLEVQNLENFERQLSGDRRPAFTVVKDFEYAVSDVGALLDFTLEPGCYATAFLREVMKRSF